jgi:dTDP-L-rhamnose 4-epimerase
MRILVTGGAGFIGSAVVDALVARGDDVVVVDSIVARAHRAAPDYLNPAASYVFDDLAKPAVAARAVDGADAVCHQAALVGLGTDFGDVTDYVAHNDQATAVLLRALHRRRFTGRIVLASSMVVYGEGRYQCGEHGAVEAGPRSRERLEAARFDPACPHCGADLVVQPVDESAPADPRNIYAATKVHQEHLCFAYGREHGAAVIALRYHNVYGPRMPRDTPYAGVASIFRSAIARGEAPQVFEDGAQRRDFVHVADVARANVAALLAPDAVTGPFNVASGEPHTVYELALALSRAAASARAPAITGAFRLGDVRHVVASPVRAARTLGFTAHVAFEDGVREFATSAVRA